MQSILGLNQLLKGGYGANLLGMSLKANIPIEECKERIIKLLTDLGTPKQITLDEVEESCFVKTNSYLGRSFYIGRYDNEFRFLDELEFFGTIKVNEAYLNIEEILAVGVSIYKNTGIYL